MLFSLRRQQHNPIVCYVPHAHTHSLTPQVGLLGPDGSDLPLHLEGKGAVGNSTVLRCDAAKNSFTFTDVAVSQMVVAAKGC